MWCKYVREAMYPYGSYLETGTGGAGTTTITDQYVAATATLGYDAIFDMGRNNYASQSTVLADYARAVAANTSGYYWFCEILPNDNPNGSEDTGGSARATLDATNAAILSAYGNRRISILAAMQAANDGSAQDLDDVARGQVPRSLKVTGDTFHPNKLGCWVKSQAILRHIETYGP